MQERLIREPECRHLTGLSRQRRWELAGQGHFPPARKYPGMQKAVAWRLSEINAWLRGDWPPSEVQH